MTDPDQGKVREFNLYSRPPNSRTSYPFYDPVTSTNQVELTPRSYREPEPLVRATSQRKPVNLSKPLPRPQPQAVVPAEQAKPIVRYQPRPQLQSELTNWPNKFSYHFCNCFEDFKITALAFCCFPW
jgi:hypothetical protein